MKQFRTGRTGSIFLFRQACGWYLTSRCCMRASIRPGAQGCWSKFEGPARSTHPKKVKHVRQASKKEENLTSCQKPCLLCPSQSLFSCLDDPPRSPDI